MAQKGLTVGRAGSHVGNDQVGGAFRAAAVQYEAGTITWNLVVYSGIPRLKISADVISFALTVPSGTPRIRVTADPIVFSFTVPDTTPRLRVAGDAINFGLTVPDATPRLIGELDPITFQWNVPDGVATVGEPPAVEVPQTGALPGAWLHRRLQEEEDSLARIKEQNEIVLLLCQAVAAEEQLWAA